MRRGSICLFIYLFVCNYTQAQTVTPVTALQKSVVTSIARARISLNAARFADTSVTAMHYNTPFTFMASNYYTNALGFFCKKEIQMERALKFPLKFRLGSVAYTDKMEGKGAGILSGAGKR